MPQRRAQLSCRAVLEEVKRIADVGFNRLCGLEISEAENGRIRGRLTVRDELKQPAGLVHGGVYAAIAESLASTGTAVAVMGEGKVAMGISNLTTFMRPITTGTVIAEAHRQASWTHHLGMGDRDHR